ncbi:porin [Buchnera aphidicola]|uniref:OmpF-like porin n=1 Tax=Buchnera aphidicola str. Ua (Uroleucon ambrosiae) TaxID=1005057 RepID=G2LPL2_BUCUM|nr:porin [Buchnera aphidicola]AEO08149.1 OmpF-like porin [Buchnera aphidicola str. Ua (Uroleucon ambrosiae)]
MTNRKSLAIIIPILLGMSNGINAAEIFNKNGNQLKLYGSINPNYKLSHGFLSSTITSNSDDTNAILGLSGTININDELLSYGTLEYQTHFSYPEKLLNAQQSNTVRLGYAGFKYADWGSIDYGRNYGIFNDVQLLTNHMPYINQDSFFNHHDHYMIGRNNGLLTYRNNNVFGLVDGVSFAVQYQDAAKNQSNKKQKGDIWGASVKYETDIGFTAVGSFFSSPNLFLNKDDKNNKSDNIGAYGLGFKYNVNNVYIAAFYGEARNLIPDNVINNNEATNNNNNNQDNTKPYINTTQNIEAIAEYDFHSGFYSALSYLDSKKQTSIFKDGANKNDITSSKQINISTRYEFNKNISTYMNYKINLLKNDNADKNQNNFTDNTIGAGIVYQF